MNQEDKIIKLPSVANQKVVIRNCLIRTPMNMTIVQAKIIRALIALIDKSDTDFFTYRCTFAELIRVAGISKKAYENKAKILQTIKELETIHYIKEGDKIIKRTIHWVTIFDEVVGTNEIRIRLNDALKPYVLQIKEQYTSYWLADILMIISMYTLRIYEYLNSYYSIIKEENNNGNPYVVQMEALKELLGIQEGDYKHEYDFARKIKKSLNDINKKTQMQITYEIQHDKGNWAVVIISLIARGRDINHNVIADAPSQVIDESKKRYITYMIDFYEESIGHKAGIRLRRKFEECYDQYVQIGKIREAIQYTAQKREEGAIKTSIEAYTRTMIDIAIQGKMVLREENRVLCSKDRTTPEEVEIFGSANAAQEARDRILNCEVTTPNIPSRSQSELYIVSVRWFAEKKCKFHTMDHAFYRTTVENCKNGTDIRIIFDALNKTQIYRWKAITNGDDFNEYAYATSVIEDSLRWNIQYCDDVSYMDLDWCLENIEQHCL